MFRKVNLFALVATVSLLSVLTGSVQAAETFTMPTGWAVQDIFDAIVGDHAVKFILILTSLGILALVTGFGKGLLGRISKMGGGGKTK